VSVPLKEGYGSGSLLKSRIWIRSKIDRIHFSESISIVTAYRVPTVCFLIIPENQLLGGLGLLPQDGFGLAAKALLLPIVSKGM